MRDKKNILSSILSLPRFAKQIIALLCDFNLCLICVVGAFYLRLDQLLPIKGPVLIAAILSVLLALPVFWLVGLYRTIFRYSGTSIFLTVSTGIIIYSLLYFSCFTLYRIEGVPRSIGLLQPMLLFFLIISSRLLVKVSLGKIDKKNSKPLKTTLIYGAGNAGRQLANLLENSFEFKIVGFLDDDFRIQGKNLQGHTVYNPAKLEKLIETKNIELILLALPSLSRNKRNAILKSINKHKLIVQTLPSISDIIDGKINVSDIKELDINDILSRQPVPPKKELLSKNIENKTVLVSGAGGSIGSELCRQIIKLSPKKLILCELNEFALYKINEELQMIDKNISVIPLITNIQNENKIDAILKKFKVDTIYHSAAYKHVPIVEANICDGVLNNVFGTYNIAKKAIEHRVSDFVLISSDKAVRPTNVMGATKRLSELCIQALSNHYQQKKTKMSMVRFGNVLDSSGSVIPKFKKQIKEGGPITLTHPEVTRYFMTIPEAAQLVIQAGAMSKQCDVFVLDMGESVKIKDLIHRVIHLSGLSIKNDENPDGDIEIKVIGLRPGEKLYEELLIGDNPQPTKHEKILKTQDPFIPLGELEKNLNELKSFSESYKPSAAKETLQDILTDFVSKNEIIDYMDLNSNSNS